MELASHGQRSGQGSACAASLFRFQTKRRTRRQASSDETVQQVRRGAAQRSRQSYPNDLKLELFGAAHLDPFRHRQPEQPAESEIEPPPAAIPRHRSVVAAAAVTDMPGTALLAQKLRVMHQKNMGILTGTGSAEPADPAIDLPLQHHNTSSRQRSLATIRPASSPALSLGTVAGSSWSPYRHQAGLAEENNSRTPSWQALFPGNLTLNCPEGGHP